jgi:hypothetical protein
LAMASSSLLDKRRVGNFQVSLVIAIFSAHR